MNTVPVLRGISSLGRGGMVGLTAGLLCLLTMPPLLAADAPLSFSLGRSEDQGGDFPLVFYTFRGGSKRFTFCPPANWKITGGATSMSFSVPTRDGDAVARFRISSPAELALLHPELQAHREPAFRQNLPAGFSDLKQVGVEDTDPVPVLSHESVEISYRYNFFGLAFGASVMICHLDEQNGFTLVIIAPAEIYGDFFAQVHRTLGTMRIDADEVPSDPR